MKAMKAIRKESYKAHLQLVEKYLKTREDLEQSKR